MKSGSVHLLSSFGRETIQRSLDYEQHRRIRHGTYLDMVDQAYLAWQADTRAGKTSILIAADNDTVSMLNERAQADLVAQGAVDPEQRVLLSGGSYAGSGDTIIARGNDRRIVDSDGDFRPEWNPVRRRRRQ
jgi:hypothetical protein